MNKKQNKVEISKTVCSKKTSKNRKHIKKTPKSQKKNHNSLSIIQRLREKILIFGSNGVNKDMFDKSSHQINVNNVHINKIVMSDKRLYVKKVLFNTSLDTNVIMILDH